jgi:S-adenosylmethionine:tRNA-ribosyltransferase-isomerase (queuine synthetase)
MIPESRPPQRPPNARLLTVDAAGGMCAQPRANFAKLLRPGDLVVANDAATLPASLHGHHVTTGAQIEVRLDAATLRRIDAELDAGCYRSHEFGDSLLVECRYGL